MSTTRIIAGVEENALRSIALDLGQLCFDIAGIVDPTPISDGVSMLIAIGRGNWFDAALSGISMVPYVGDLAKAGKFPKYLKTLERAIQLASQSAEAANLLKPVISRLDRLLQMLPQNVPGDLANLRRMVSDFMSRNSVARHAAAALPDIRRHFNFRRYTQGGFEYVEATGKLGVPGKVMQHRSESAQRALSGGTGDHAGHLIGNQFGAPGDGLNLGLQNANINTRAPRAQQHWIGGSGGSYLDLEKRWAEKLESGIGIEVRVRDQYRLGEARPIARHVDWTEIHPNGTRTENTGLSFLNSSSPQSRAATGQ